MDSHEEKSGADVARGRGPRTERVQVFLARPALPVSPCGAAGRDGRHARSGRTRTSVVGASAMLEHVRGRGTRRIGCGLRRSDSHRSTNLVNLQEQVSGRARPPDAYR